MAEITRAGIAGWMTAGALDARVAAGEHFPIVEGGTCTFAYRGEVIAVRLVHFGVGLPGNLDFEHLGDSDWWLLALTMPAGARLEYKLEVVDSFGTHDVDDPLNPHDADHPFGSNSVCLAGGYHLPDWAVAEEGVPAGRLCDWYCESAALGRKATASIYLPPGFDPLVEQRYPLLVVHDGSDYLLYAGAATALDNLIHRRGLVPLVVAFSNPGERLVEYANDPRHHRHVIEELVPELEHDLPLVGTAAGRGLMGCSFGAIASLSTAVSAPGFFGRLLLQSGSFAGAGAGCRPRPERLWEPVREFVRRFVETPAAVAERVVLTCGAFESLICENRAMLDVLGATGMDVRFIEELDGHNWVCWRDSLGLALPWLFGGGG